VLQGVSAGRERTTTLLEVATLVHSTVGRGKNNPVAVPVFIRESKTECGRGMHGTGSRVVAEWINRVGPSVSNGSQVVGPPGIAEAASPKPLIIG
jgi:hypothetical protein